jgi:hypothetical protein
MRRAAMSTDYHSARTWAEDPEASRRRDLTGEEDRAFWTWAAVETLRHTGIRIEELTELSHHSLIQYTLPDGEVVPLLQIAPSKTDAERLLVVSPELVDVLATIIIRVRRGGGGVGVGCVASYDTHERVWNPSMPFCSNARSASSTGPSLPPACGTGSARRSREAASPTPLASRCASARTTSAGCSSPTQSCTACRRTSPSWSRVIATSTQPWGTRPSTPKK